MTDDTIEMREELVTLIKNVSDSSATTDWILKNYKVGAVADLSGAQLKHVINLLTQKAKKDENPKS